MSGPSVTDAARLAARYVGAAAPPREVEVGLAWLDLRDAPEKVAAARASDVAAALGPCLALQPESRLIVTTGATPPAVIARTLAASLHAIDLPETLVATLRGEGVLDRLEEFALAGCDFSDAEGVARKLAEERRLPSSALAAVPTGVLLEGLESGAPILLTRTAGREAIEAAAKEAPDDEPKVCVTVRFPVRQEAVVAIVGSQSTTQVHDELTPLLPSGVRLSIDGTADAEVLRLTADNPAAMHQACRLVTLSLPGLPTPLADLVTTTAESWTIEVPRELLDFAIDTRPATEWLETTNPNT